jgi:AAA domain-containing protein
VVIAGAGLKGPAVAQCSAPITRKIAIAITTPVLASGGIAVRAEESQKLPKTFSARRPALAKYLVLTKQNAKIAAQSRGSAEGITLQPYSEIEAKSIEWLWKNRIPCGALTIFAGDPGVGKSLGTVDLTARVSRGLPWPDESGNAPLGDVIILSCEDDHEMTIRPRLDAAGADVSRVYRLCALTAGKDGKRTERIFNLEKDVEQLHKALCRYPDAKLIVIDPVSAYLKGVNDFKEAEVRQALAPLIMLASETGIAVIGIKHFNKDSEKQAMYRMSGSIGYVAVARAAWIFVSDPDDESRTLLLVVKSNLGPKVDGLKFRIMKREDALAPRIEWLGATEMGAEDALKEKRGPRGEKLEEAKQFLTKLLYDSGMGAANSKEIMRQAKAVGIAERTIWRAKKELKLVAEECAGEWRWLLPAD